MIIIYHHKDLDGKASGAIAKMYFQKDNPIMYGYHYGEPIDHALLEGQDIVMADVTFPIEEMMAIAKKAKSFTLIDHHVSFNDVFLDYIAKETLSVIKQEFSGLIDWYTLPDYSIDYYYSTRFAACEMMLQLYSVGNEHTMSNIKLLGQYDTWRKDNDKKFVSDVNWDIVLEHQYGFRLNLALQDVERGFGTDPKEHIFIGKTILAYQSQLNATSMQRSFDFELCGLKIIACEGVQFNSNSFDVVYNPEFHDAMMPFNFDGQTKRWNFSLYTTKPEVDILSIAKSFGGGGHAQACGFQLTGDRVRFNLNGFAFVIIINEEVRIPLPPIDQVIESQPVEEIKGLCDDDELASIGILEKALIENEVKSKIKSNVKQQPSARRTGNSKN